MAKFTRQEIKDAGAALLEQSPKGVRYSALAQKIHSLAPETPINTVYGSLNALRYDRSDIARPSRGVWILEKYRTASEQLPAGSVDEPTTATVPPAVATEPPTRFNEEAFYEPFAEWLAAEAEVTESHVVGGAAFRSKWGTPDVIGVYKPRKSDFIKFEIEIVTAEIKVDPIQSVVAFGQACAYRLFSHKTYIVMPRSIAPDDQDRLDALCAIYGVGLVLFNLDTANPDFQFVRKAQRFQPDMYYTNEFARRLHDVSRNDFDRLFQ